MSVDHTSRFVKHQTVTRDAFLGGRLHVSQPSHGFRAGTDSVLLGASIDPKGDRILDMGAGVGVAALTALAHHPQSAALLVDADEHIAALAGRNIAENGFAEKARAVTADVTAPGKTRVAAGMEENGFASIIANPPYFEEGGGTRAPDPGRAAARHMGAGAIQSWVKTAASCAAAHAEVVFIYRADGLPELLGAFCERFGGVSVLPLAPRDGQSAQRVLVGGIKGSRAPMTLLPPLILHGPKGRDLTPGVDAVCKGEARLRWRDGSIVPK